MNLDDKFFIPNRVIFSTNVFEHKNFYGLFVVSMMFFVVF